MTIQELSQAGALTAGADLWFVPALNQSHWTNHIDWYLNFQFVKAKLHQRKELSPHLKELSEDWEFPLEEIDLSMNRDLLISSRKLLPNQFTVQVEYDGNLNTWIERLLSIWKSLKRPSLRVFLPEGVSRSDFEKATEGIEDPEHITVIPNE